MTMKQLIIRQVRFRVLPDPDLTKCVLAVGTLGIILLLWLTVTAISCK